MFYRTFQSRKCDRETDRCSYLVFVRKAPRGASSAELPLCRSAQCPPGGGTSLPRGSRPRPPPVTVPHGPEPTSPLKRGECPLPTLRPSSPGRAEGPPQPRAPCLRLNFISQTERFSSWGWGRTGPLDTGQLEASATASRVTENPARPRMAPVPPPPRPGPTPTLPYENPGSLGPGGPPLHPPQVLRGFVTYVGC